MGRRQFIGLGRVYWVPSINNIAAPTVAEIEAGVDLTPFGRQDSPKTSQEAAKVDNSDLTSLFDKTSIGTRSADLSINLYRDSVAANDDAWNALPIGTTGNLVIARFGFSGAGNPKAPAANDRVEVWPAEVSMRSPADIAKNENQWFTAAFATPEEPNLDSVVAA